MATVYAPHKQSLNPLCTICMYVPIHTHPAPGSDNPIQDVAIPIYPIPLGQAMLEITCVIMLVEGRLGFSTSKQVIEACKMLQNAMQNQLPVKHACFPNSIPIPKLHHLPFLLGNPPPPSP